MALVRENTVSDATQVVNSGGGALSAVALDCGTNSDRIALVTVGWHNGGGHTITGVTIGGNAMTEWGAEESGGARSTHGFYYIGPDSGSQDIVVTFSTGSLDNRCVVITGLSYSGADQSTPLSGYNSLTDTAGEADITISSATDSLVIAAASTADGTWTTDDAGATELIDVSNTAAAADCSHTVSERPGAASVTAEHTSTLGGATPTVIGVSLAPATAGGTTFSPDPYYRNLLSGQHGVAA